MKTPLAIINPVAGAGRCSKQASKVLSDLRSTGFRLDTVETRAPHEATYIARNAYRQGRRCFIAVGGDGTAFEIINGLFPEATDSPPVRLGFLPLGTGNSFLRDFSKSPQDYAIESLLRGRGRTCDVVRFTHDRGTFYYINILSIGFSASVGSITNRYFKPLGTLGYGLSVVANLARLKSHSYPFYIDGDNLWRRKSLLVSFCNSRYTGGSMMMAPQADTSDGKLDITFIGMMGRLRFLQTFPKIYDGTHISQYSIDTAQAITVEFDISEEISLMIDGEIFRCKPKRLDIISNVLEVIT